MPKTQQEIVRQGYHALIESLGIVNTLRFIQYLSPGQGDYTQERHAWLDQNALEDRLATLGQRQNNDLTQYDEIIE